MNQLHVLVPSRNELDDPVQKVVAHDAPRVLQLPIRQWRIQLVEHHLHQRRVALFAMHLEHLDVVDVRREPDDLVALVTAQLPVRVALAVQHHHALTPTLLQLVAVVGTPTPHAHAHLSRTHAVRQQPELARRVEALVAPHVREALERRVVVAEGTQHEGRAHEALRVAQREQQQIETVQRTLQLLVQLDRSVGRQRVSA